MLCFSEDKPSLFLSGRSLFLDELLDSAFKVTQHFQFCSLEHGAITKLKISVGWTIDKFWLNNSLAINGTILRFAYRKIDV